MVKFFQLEAIFIRCSIVGPRSESQQAPLAKTALFICYFEECPFLKTYARNFYCTPNFIFYARKYIYVHIYVKHLVSMIPQTKIHLIPLWVFILKQPPN